MDYKSKSSKSFKTKVTGKSTSSAMRGGYKNYRKISKKRKYAPYGSNNKTGFIARLTHNPNLKKAIIALISAFAFIGVILIFGVTVYLKNISDKIPSPDTLLEREFEESTKIYDRNGVLLYTTYGDQNRQYITIDKLPSHTKWALLAAEDVDFYKHNGVDWPGVVMAGVEMIKRRDTSGRGSSTISQQLVRNTVLVDILGEEAYKKAVSRKIQEMLITLNFEQELTKDQILEYYINVIPLGGVVYGYQTGAEIYFGKDISELTLAESAILAGIIQAPGYYSPLFGIEPTKADIRKNYVLDQLENNLDYINNELSKEGKEPITHEDIENARNEEIIYKSKPLDIKAPHFVFYVLDELNEKYGEEYVKRGGLNVTTTLDYDLFQIGNDEIHKLYESEKAQTQYNVHNAAMVAIDPRSGEILVMIGSYDYFAQDDPRVDGNVNVADSLRQMGSSVKPIGYLTSFTQGYYPTLLTPDIPMEFGNYKLKNWDGKFQNHRLLRDALLHSRNIPAVYITQLTGVDAWIETAEKLGVTSLTDRSNFGLSIAVGAAEIKLIELTQAYTVFATGGIKREAEAILKITDRKGEIIYEINKEREERVFSEQEIYLLNWVLCNDSGASRLGSNYFKVGGKRVCGKTGTTDGPRDLTTVLYHTNLVVGVWAGNNNNEVTCGVRRADGDCGGAQASSSTIPLPLAHSFMTRVSGMYSPEVPSRPGNIVSTSVCLDSGLPADSSNSCRKTTGVFISGKLPEKDNSHKMVAICTLNNKIASNEVEARKMNLVKDVYVIDLPLANTLQTATWEKWLVENKGTIASLNEIGVDDFIYKFQLPEADVCPLGLGANNEPIVAIASPTDQMKFVIGESLTVSYSVNSLEPIIAVDVLIDNNPVPGSSVAGNPGSVTFNIPSTLSTGNHSLSVVVTDNGLRKGSASVSIQTIKTYDVSLSITEPTSGTTFTSSGTEYVEITVGGADRSKVSSIELVITNQGGTIVQTMNCTKDSNEKWKTTLDINELSNGNYSLKAIAKTDIKNYTSSSISIKVAK